MPTRRRVFVRQLSGLVLIWVAVAGIALAAWYGAVWYLLTVPYLVAVSIELFGPETRVRRSRRASHRRRDNA